MDELARSLAFVAFGRLEPEPAETSHADPREDARDGRERHPERLRDLGAGEAQPAQRGDRLDAGFVGPVGDAMRRAGTIEQAALSLGPEAPDPATRPR